MSDISITGAAIAGPAAALRLSLLGHNVTVYEQRPQDALFSAGILGLTHQNWQLTESFGVDLASYELDNGFYDYRTDVTSVSPFRYIVWTDLHDALERAAKDAGARFVYERKIARPESMKTLVGSERPIDYTVDATGIAGASRLHLPHQYSGITIYRGLSATNTERPFAVYAIEPGRYFNVGHTRNGAAWAFLLSRPEPASLRTYETNEFPPETHLLPDEFSEIVWTTSQIVASPLSYWEVPRHMTSNTFGHFTVGDVNGPISPITTSGANLALEEGFAISSLLGTDYKVSVATESALLNRRAYDLMLGRELLGPEIGGTIEDDGYQAHHTMLFPGDF